MKRGKLLFLITEDWFFRSHFLPLARRAAEEGYDVAIGARMSGVLTRDETAGARLIDAPFARGSLNVSHLAREARFVRSLIAEEKPDIVHAIALKPIALTLLADMGLRPSGRVFAVTGRGYLALARKPWAHVASGGLARLLRAALEGPRAVLAVENLTDRTWAEGKASLPDARVVLMPGAGVELDRFRASPEPPAPPIVVGVVTRLVYSKGVDIVVAAVTSLRQRGLDIKLRIAGAADAENPEHVAEGDIARWRQTPGVEMLGHIADVSGFWAHAQIACLATRGGEGLPRSLLEAAACARPLVTTDVPGCRDFVTDGETGFVVAPDDPAALARALEVFANDRDLRTRMGAKARARVEARYTVEAAADAAALAWRKAMA